ncbi:hypothetical protein B1757_13440 [Acidithiobacillus marinus]|uniref:DNA 3'-5' helicase n=1 Tax=Acidithiobacillus marinus TaxID=187490 RepID=A0A2I1DIM6_9PROT|nr:ATP-dependent helicase [Acidithiobacillus marinus]PKY09726.1 hypothetical protein B1757_13440 [Acidithiobacillus marinus]
MLTAEQQAAALHREGNALIIAGPGSGKSTTLRHLAANHIQQGITRAEDMLIVMFSEKAARDFAAKLKTLCRQKTPLVSTIHSAAFRFLRSVYRAGLDAPKTLRTEDYYWDQITAAAIAKTRRIHVEDVDAQDIEEARKIIGILKANLITPDMVNRQVAEQVGMEDADIGIDIYKAYEKMRKEEATISFDDMIYDLVNLYFNDENVQNIMKNTYKTVLIDEFQDMNRANMEFVRIIAQNAIAIGDDDQSIFGFRGCSPYYMTHEFERLFQDVTRYQITQTFRYGEALSRVANKLIERNSDRIAKTIVTANGVPNTEVHLRCTDRPGDATLEVIQENISQSGSIGILVRTFHQSALCEIALTEAGIPYVLEGGTPAFERRDALATVGYLAASMGKLGNTGWFHDQDRLRKIVRAMLTTPNRFMRREDLEAAEEAVIQEESLDPWIKRTMQKNTTGQGTYAQRLYATLDNLKGHIGFLRQMHENEGSSAATMIRAIYGKLGLHEAIRQAGPSDRAQDRTAFYAVMADYAATNQLSTAQFVQEIESLAQKNRRSKLSPRNTARIHIGSWHAAKGREFDLVILPDLAEGKTPYIRADKDGPDIDEERRLFYVAMTRARQRLVLLSPIDDALTRSPRKGQGASKDRKSPKASRFLYEIASCPSLIRQESRLDRAS